MRDLLMSLFCFCYGANNKNRYKESNKILWIVTNVGSRLFAILIYIDRKIYALRNKYPQPLSADNDIIISLTTFPQRINNVWMVVDSLFHQQITPSKICLYLSKEEFPKGKISLPQRLLKYQELGLEIFFRDINLKPHNKYYYALQEFHDKIVITVDDDIYYPKNLVSNLIAIYKRNPLCICSNTIIKLKTQNNSYAPYSEWKQEVEECTPSNTNLALGFDGVLYPPNVFKKVTVYDKGLIVMLCLKADDLWLKANEILEDIHVANGNYYCSGPIISGSQVTSLMSSNCIGGNDQQWKQLCDYFKIRVNLLR